MPLVTVYILELRDLEFKIYIKYKVLWMLNFLHPLSFLLENIEISFKLSVT